ncbi:pyrroline-5-carboxylate reductase [Candidatus Bathyarchaeota archaeon]|nr:pyrroline-5-carboxylate reductase [Candidatus Bathyarchaeota archaeon]
MINDLRVCVIGVGKIGEALVHCLISKNILESSRILAVDTLRERCEYIKGKYGIECSSDISRVVQRCDTIIIAVKPKDVRSVAEALSTYVTPKQLVITLAAGVSAGFLSGILRGKPPIIRAMPNIAMLVGESMTAIAKGPNASDEHLALAQEIFSSAGRVVVVEEKQMDAVTALSGSGPAYIYTIIEALSDGGVKVGLERSLATVLAAQTTLGAARMVLETKEHPAKLKDMVTTPGGTTAEGLMQLEKGKIRAVLMGAVIEAARKSERLLKS